MLHDLLFSMLGKPGSYIRQVNQGGQFEIDDSLNLFSKPEISIINSVVELGYHYQQIEVFINQASQICLFGVSKEVKADSSTYLRAFAFGVNESLNDYRQLILTIEQDYLREKVFMVSQLQAQLSIYYVTLPDLHKSVTYVMNERLRGGQLLDYLYEKMQSGNHHLSTTYQKILTICYEVLFQQLQAWILYGQIYDQHEEFFIQKIEEKKVDSESIKQNNAIEQDEYSWENTYTLKTGMLCLHFISLQQAEKILFIGKSVKVLKVQNSLFLPDQDIIDIIMTMREYDTFKFNRAVEVIRDYIGKQLLEVIVNKSELMIHLHNIKQFVLLGNGEFFQAFFDEAQKILQFPQTTNAVHEMNFNILQQIFNKLKMDDDLKVRKLQFAIFHNGFEYKNFHSLSNLLIQGNIIQTLSNNLRLGPVKRQTDSGGIFHDIKQSVENGFSMIVTFRFKPLIQIQTNYKTLGQDSDTNSSSLVVLLHNSDLAHLSQGLWGIQDGAILIRVSVNQKKQSMISMEIKQSNGSQKIETLCKWRYDPTQLDFSEGDLYTLKITYKGDEFAFMIDDGMRIADGIEDQPQKVVNSLNSEQLISPSTWVKINVKLQKYLSLEMGRCYVGLANEGENGQNMIDVCSWKMTGFNVFNNEDSWNGLNLRYKISHPLTLLITPAFQEKLIMFFRYFFPIRHTQYQLNEVWLILTRRAKDGMIISDNIPKQSNYQKHSIMNTKEFRFIMIVHNQILHVINSFWNYFQYDILQVQWQRLLVKIQTVTDFEQLRKILDDFQMAVSTQIFLNFPQIIKQIFSIVRFAKRYIELIHRLYYQQSIETIYKESQKIKFEFEEAFMNLYNLITLLNKSTNQVSLFQLLIRLDFNGYFNDKNNDHYKI